MQPPDALTLALGFVASGLALASPAAGSQTLLPASTIAVPGRVLELHATATPGDSCRLTFDGHQVRLTVPEAGAFSLAAAVAARARSGVHVLTLRCSAGRARATVKVGRTGRNRRTRRPLFTGPFRMVAGANAALAPPPSTPFARTLGPASTEARSWWMNNAATIVTAFRNGQCTDWAQQRRPDIVEGGFKRRYELQGADAITMSWDARRWPANAAEAGIAVAHAPVVGAVMVLQPGTHGAGASGHVAIVESVAPDGAFVVSHMNAPDVGQVTQLMFSARQAAAMAQDPGIAFIQ